MSVRRIASPDRGREASPSVPDISARHQCPTSVPDIGAKTSVPDISAKTSVLVFRPMASQRVVGEVAARITPHGVDVVRVAS